MGRTTLNGREAAAASAGIPESRACAALDGHGSDEGHRAGLRSGPRSSQPVRTRSTNRPIRTNASSICSYAVA